MTIATELHLNCQLPYCRNRPKKGNINYGIYNVESQITSVCLEHCSKKHWHDSDIVLLYASACVLLSANHHQHTQQTVPTITDGCQ